MHMARLWDASRKGNGAYSLEQLSRTILETRKIKVVSKFKFIPKPKPHLFCPFLEIFEFCDVHALKNQGMIRRFGVFPIKKDGTPAALPRIPPLEDLQRSPKNILSWIDYSTLDTEVTWFLREALHRKYVPNF
jgi:DNA polymerase-1